MRQPCAVEIVFARLEYLCLRLQTSEGIGEDDAVALNLKGVAVVGVGYGRGGEAFEVEVVIESVLHAILACLPSLVSVQPCLISIMKYPKSSFVLGLLCAVVVLSALSSTAEARIGERKDSIERRLFASGGIMYRDDAVEESRRKGMPYLKYMELIVDSTDIRIYYKTADGRRPASQELEEKRMLPGWDMHVLYVNGKSAVEVYKRSQRMTEYEFNQLLAVQSNGSYWKKKAKGAKTADGKPVKDPSAFGYEMQTDNGTVRAKKMGNGIIFFDPKLDVMLAEMNDSDQIEKAPVSVNGF